MKGPAPFLLMDNTNNILMRDIIPLSSANSRRMLHICCVSYIVFLPPHRPITTRVLSVQVSQQSLIVDSEAGQVAEPVRKGSDFLRDNDFLNCQRGNLEFKSSSNNSVSVRDYHLPNSRSRWLKDCKYT